MWIEELCSNILLHLTALVRSIPRAFIPRHVWQRLTAAAAQFVSLCYTLLFHSRRHQTACTIYSNMFKRFHTSINIHMGNTQCVRVLAHIKSAFSFCVL